MPRPWFESTAVIAFGSPAGPLRPRLTYWRPRMDDLRYALLRQGRAELDSRPVGYPNLPSLARAIEREREGRPLELVEREDFEFDDDDQLHTVVEIWTLDMGNSRDERIGVAWLNEAGRETLEPALRAARADRPQSPATPEGGMSSATDQDDRELCPICLVPFEADDLCATDITEGTCHAECLAGSPVVNLDTGEPIEGQATVYRYGDLPQPEGKQS